MEAPVHPGQVLAGKFRVERVIGVGGMGVVVAAWHLKLEERVALKFLLPDALSQPEVVERFAREARHAARIKSEHIARVTDVGALETGAPYMVMEYLEGDDLAAVLAKRGPLPIVDAVDYLIQACEAVAEAHSLGIIHRDLKPSNLFLTVRRDGVPCIKVLDFGISKAALSGKQPDISLTSTKAVMGSPLYMPPEQMHAARDVDHRADIWSLGATLHELLAGKVAFEGENVAQICSAVLTEPPRPLRAQRPDAPVGLERVVLRCLEKQAANRYANVGELAVALAPFAPPRALATVERVAAMARASGAHVDFEVHHASAGATPELRTKTSWVGEDAQLLPRRRSQATLAVIALALLGLGGASLFIVRRLARTDATPGTLTAQPLAPTSASAPAAPTVEVVPAPPSATPRPSASAPPRPTGGGRQQVRAPPKPPPTGVDIGF